MACTCRICLPFDDSAVLTFYIREEDGKYCVYSKDGKKLGTHDSRADAEKQLAAIEKNKALHDAYDHAYAHADDFEVEIFATGSWGGLDWSETDLDEMVRNFDALHPKGIKPPVKLGHDDTQVLGGQKDGQPALGWIAGLRRNGEKLLARVTQVPKILRELVNQGRYKRVSSEIYPTFEATGAEKNLKSGVTGRVLSGIAFLGADIPEVKTLEDLGRVLAAEGLSCADGSCADGARGFVAEGSAGVSNPGRPSLSLLADAVLAELTERGALRGENHPRTSAPTGDAMAENDKDPKDAAAKFAERLDAMEKKMAEDRATAEGEIKRLTDESKRLADENKGLRDRESANEQRALEAEAKQWVAERSVKGNFRLFQSQQPIARLLYQRLTDDAPIVKCAEAEAAGIAKPGDMTARELFRRFVDATPNVAILEERAHSQPNGNGQSDDVNTVLSEIATREKLDLTDRDQRLRALDILSRERKDLIRPAGRAARAA